MKPRKIVALTQGKASRQKWGPYLKENYDLYLFLVPAVLALILFSYWPIYGIQIAFKNYIPVEGFTGSPWIGFAHFTRFFQSPYFGLLMKNTLILSLYTLIAGFPVPIILALLLNSMKNKRYRKVVQTVTYAPYFISTVVMCGMIVLFLSPRSGVINQVIAAFGGERISFLAKPEYFRHIYVLSGIWQTTGWSSVIYFAALSGVSPELHEAATMDGASRFQRIMHIDFPSILPTITMLLILNFGSLMSVGFEKVYLLMNSQNSKTAEIIATYVYKMGIQNNDVSFSTAIGLFNSLINVVLLISVNWVSKKISNNSLW